MCLRQTGEPMAKRFVEAPAPRAAGGGASDASRFQLLVQGIVDYAIYMVSPEGVVTSWNAGAVRFDGAPGT